MAGNTIQDLFTKNRAADFSQTLTPIAPTAPDTSGIVTAAKTEAEATVATSKANMGIIKEVADQGQAAVKGFLESGLERDIKKTLDTYKTSVNYDNAVLQHDMLAAGFVEGGPADLEKAKAEISKYKAAMDQGTMSREQALLAIDKSVKDYSNTMPGYAADFRKLGYQLTGVEHLGAYEAFSALTKQSISEKLKYDQALFIQNTNQKMLTDFVQDYKRWPVGGLNGNEMNVYRQQAQLKQVAANLKTETEVKDQTVAQVEPKVVNYINTRLADGILTLNTKLQTIPFSINPTTGKPNPPEDKAVQRERTLADVTTFFEGLKSELLGFNANQISNQTREQQMSRIQNQQTEMVNALKNQDVFDNFKKIMEINQAKAQDVMNQWAIANPQMKIMQQSGLPTPDNAKFWIDSQRDPKMKADFVRVYGPLLDNYWRSIVTGGQGVQDVHTNNMARLSTDPTHLDRLRETDPGAWSAGLHTVRDGIKSVISNGWGETPQMQQIQKKSFANWIAGFGSQVTPQRVDLVDEWTKTMSDPRLVERLKELPGDQQLQAADAIMSRTRQILENPDVGYMRRLDNLVQEANSNFRGVKYDLVLNPVTKQIELAKTETKLTGKSQSGQTEQVTSPAGNLLGFGEVAKTLQTINKGLTVLSNVGTGVENVMPADMKARTIQADYLAKLKAGYFNLSYADRAKALESAPTGQNSESTSKKKPNAGEQQMKKDMTDPSLDPQVDSFEEQNRQMIMDLSDRINDPGFKGLEPSRQKILVDLLNLLKQQNSESGKKQ